MVGVIVGGKKGGRKEIFRMIVKHFQPGFLCQPDPYVDPGFQ